MNILDLLKEDNASFEEMKITFEEKAFYDILIKVRDTHGFPYADEKCITLAKGIRSLLMIQHNMQIGRQEMILRVS